MGVNLRLDRNGNELPISEFDWCRHALDSDLANSASELSTKHWFDERELNHYYVIDPAKMRAWGAGQDCNHERWELIASLFEKYDDLRLSANW